MDLSGLGQLFEHSLVGGALVAILAFCIRSQRSAAAEVKAAHARADGIQQQRVGDMRRTMERMERLAEDYHRTVAALAEGGDVR